MAQDLVQDKDDGTVIPGTRVTVYSLVPYLLDEGASEEQIATSFGISTAQVAAARAYVLQNAPTILARHYEIEERARRGNSPELVEKMRRSHARLLSFKEWLKQREACDSQGKQGKGRFPTFDEWFARDPRATSGA